MKRVISFGVFVFFGVEVCGEWGKRIILALLILSDHFKKLLNAKGYTQI